MLSSLLDNPGFYLFGTSFKIYWYAVLMVTAIAVSAVLTGLLIKRRNMSVELLLLGFVICVPCAIVGARLFYCITDGVPVQHWLNTREGGMSILGSLIGGIGAGLVFCLVKKIPFFRVADCVLPTLPIAQAIGRWGNFLNQEVYGKVVSNEALQFFPVAVYIDKVGEWHYALFFYEGCVNVLIFALLFSLAWNYGKKPNGLLGCAMVMFYGIVRTIMEPLRDEAYILGGSDVMYSQLTSIGMIVLGAAGIIALLIVNKKREGKFFGSEKGDPYGIGTFIKCYKTDEPKYDKWNLATKLYHREAVKAEATVKGENPAGVDGGKDTSDKKSDGEDGK